MNDDDLTSRARRLRQNIRPKTDLWVGIEREMASPSRFSRLPIAIAATLVIGVSLFVWQMTTVDRSSEVQNAPLVSQDLNEGLSQGYNAAEFGLIKAELMAGYRTGLDQASPETRAVVEKNMETIAAAILEINAALEQDPNNYLLQRMLATTYTNEIKLIQETHTLSQSVRQRTEI